MRLWPTRPAVSASLLAALMVVSLACGTKPVDNEVIEEPAAPSSTTAPEAEADSQEGGTGAAANMVNRIVYVGRNGGLFVTDPEGHNRFSLTGGDRVESGSGGGVLAQGLSLDSQHYWPTWSPDGTKVAASRVTTGGGGPEVSLEVFDVHTGEVSTVYRNPVPSLVAEGAPHYLYWSPDSSNLAFLVSGQQAFALLVTNTEASGSGDGPESPSVVETGAPLYFHWNRDGDSILLHGRDELKLARLPFAIGPVTLETVGYGFRTPAFSPDGNQVAYTVMKPGDTGAELYVGEPGSSVLAASILDVGPLASFAWSPDGATLAVADSDPGDRPGFQRLLLAPSQGGAVRTLAEETIVAFFWSPKGDMIAWVAVDPEDRLLELKVSPVGEPGVEEPGAKSLFRFHPSGDVLTMLTFFDQYAYSHSIWSPNGEQLVVAGAKEEPFARRNGGSAGGESVFVVDASGVEEPRELAEGSLAFWSWN